jgi:hypothetical protein
MAFTSAATRQVSVPQLNKTKPPLQVLAVTKGNSEKIKV